MRFQLINGELVQPTESCATLYRRIWHERHLDTNKIIVRMLLEGMPSFFQHWYFRSDQMIVQPYEDLSVGILHYVGPPDMAPPNLYGKNTYEINELITKGLKGGLDRF